MHNELTGVHVLVTRPALQDMSIGWLIFCWGLLIVMAEKGNKNKYLCHLALMSIYVFLKLPKCCLNKAAEH
jgi:hypothetical protein